MSDSQLSKPRLLLTGARGLIGPKIVPQLKAHYELVLTDLHAGEIDGTPVHALDITDMPQALEAMAGIDYVVHLAIASERAMTHLSQAESDDLVMRVNVVGTQHVFEAARQQGVRRIAFFSSMTVFLGEPELEHVDAGTPVRPRNLYACTKLFGEHLAEMYARQFDLPIVCIRLGQPIPIEHKLPYTALKQRPALRSVAVAYEDIAEAVLCSLRRSSPRFALVNVFSNSDQTRFERTGAERIGFTPGVFFTEDGPIPNHATPSSV